MRGPAIRPMALGVSIAVAMSAPAFAQSIVRFDGVGSTRWLDGHYIEAIEIDYDGSAWGQAFTRLTLRGTDQTDDGPVETYVIAPEATN